MGLRVPFWGLGFPFEVENFGFKAQDLGFWDLRFRVWCLRPGRVLGAWGWCLGLKVQGLVFRPRLSFRGLGLVCRPHGQGFCVQVGFRSLRV